MTPIYFYICKMNFDVMRVSISYPQVEGMIYGECRFLNHAFQVWCHIAMFSLTYSELTGTLQSLRTQFLDLHIFICTESKKPIPKSWGQLYCWMGVPELVSTLLHDTILMAYSALVWKCTILCFATRTVSRILYVLK